MTTLRVDIERIYRYLYDVKPDLPLDGRQSIEILQDVEIKLNEQMKTIKHVHDVFGFTGKV